MCICNAEHTCPLCVISPWLHAFLCSQLDAGERALVRGMRTQVEKMMLRYPEGCDEEEEEEDEEEEEGVEQEDRGDEEEEEEDSTKIHM